MVARAEQSGGLVEELARRVLIFTVKDYALIGSETNAANCWGWTKRKFLGWLRDGTMLPTLNRKGKPDFFAEESEPWAIAQGCYWFRCHTLVGNVHLYALIPWPIAAEVGRIFGIELDDPRRG